MKLLRRANSVLACHRVSHEEYFDRMSFGLYLDEFFHQLVVDMKTTSSIDQQSVEASLLSVSSPNNGGILPPLISEAVTGSRPRVENE